MHSTKKTVTQHFDHTDKRIITAFKPLWNWVIRNIILTLLVVASIIFTAFLIEDTLSSYEQQIASERSYQRSVREKVDAEKQKRVAHPHRAYIPVSESRPCFTSEEIKTLNTTDPFAPNFVSPKPPC